VFEPAVGLGQQFGGLIAQAFKGFIAFQSSVQFKFLK
jgi:hypothetical protein